MALSLIINYLSPEVMAQFLQMTNQVTRALSALMALCEPQQRASQSKVTFSDPR